MAEEVKSHARSTRVVTARSRCSLRMGKKTTPSDLVAARILKDATTWWVDESFWLGDTAGIMLVQHGLSLLSQRSQLFNCDGQD